MSLEVEHIIQHSMKARHAEYKAMDDSDICLEFGLLNVNDVENTITACTTCHYLHQHGHLLLNPETGLLEGNPNMKPPKSFNEEKHRVYLQHLASLIGQPLKMPIIPAYATRFPKAAFLYKYQERSW